MKWFTIFGFFKTLHDLRRAPSLSVDTTPPPVEWESARELAGHQPYRSGLDMIITDQINKQMRRAKIGRVVVKGRGA